MDMDRLHEVRTPRRNQAVALEQESLEVLQCIKNWTFQSSEKLKLMKKRHQNSWHWEKSAQSSEILVTCVSWHLSKLGSELEKRWTFAFWTKIVCNTSTKLQNPQNTWIIMELIIFKCLFANINEFRQMAKSLLTWKNGGMTAASRTFLMTRTVMGDLYHVSRCEAGSWIVLQKKRPMVITGNQLRYWCWE